jgi:hypothetical protein
VVPVVFLVLPVTILFALCLKPDYSRGGVSAQPSARNTIPTEVHVYGLLHERQPFTKSWATVRLSQDWTRAATAV